MCEGWIEKPLTTNGAQGEVKRVSTFGTGQSFGEISLLFDSRRGASVRARTDAVSN